MLTSMMVMPLPGIRARDLVETLETIHRDGESTRNQASSAGQAIAAADLRWFFLRWFQQARAIVNNSLSEADREKLLPLASAWRVAGAPSNHPRELIGLVTTEFDLILDRVFAAHESLQSTVERLTHRPGVLVVLDTSVLIAHRDKLSELVIADDLGERDTPAVRMVFPMAVIDELDRLKESKDQDVRWRAGHALGKLDELLGQNHGNGTGPARISDGRPKVPGGRPLPAPPAYVEVLHDPHGHVRLPIVDDEIIDRALALRDVAHATNRLRLVIFDTSQHMRARAAGLDVVKLERNDHRDSDASSGREG